VKAMVWPCIWCKRGVVVALWHNFSQFLCPVTTIRSGAGLGSQRRAPACKTGHKLGPPGCVGRQKACETEGAVDGRAHLTNEEDRRGTVLNKCACPGSSRDLAKARTACQAQPHVRPVGSAGGSY
jgi:hypothetical protein